VWRQGLANLYRPNNQTTVLMLAIGLVTALIVCIYFSQRMLLGQIAERTGANEPNLVLFDVQVDQTQSLIKLIHSFHLHLYQEVPVVTMRLAAIKGIPVEKIRRDPNSRVSSWALRREYRSTYRDHLIGTEKVLAGEWRGTNTAAESVSVSVEKGIAETLGVDLGDALTFDIDGVPVETRVQSIREVDWHRVQPNFFVLFPTGVLEPAPQFRVLVTRADSSEVAAGLQRAVVQAFPNVSVIDIGLILSTMDAVLQRVASGIRMLSLFIVVTAAVVLGSTIVSSYSVRVRESILLRTLGASRRQIFKIILAEYLCLGLCGGLSGMALGLLASWGLTYYFFATFSMPPVFGMPAVLLAVLGVTVIAGLFGSVGILNRSPLEALRQEF
jgi:putative ABC transport system permease protein